ncbi:hypothetical protein DEI82_03525 [Curtobacterium sp. MCBD17_019]|nr:hypothetical protein DEI82_03525 [Curtobacterium sp. MCBD17_019]
MMRERRPVVGNHALPESTSKSPQIEGFGSTPADGVSPVSMMATLANPTPSMEEWPRQLA